jgi:DNA-binding Lrp family transcriptional regulator
MPKREKKRNYISLPPSPAFPDGSNNNHVLLDALNINILGELLVNADVKSSLIATKYKTPLSTVQRRRTLLERTLLKKDYHLDTKELGWRTADIFIAVAKGQCHEIAETLLKDHSSMVLSTSLRIGDPNVNVAAQIIFRNSQLLHDLIERIKAMPNVTGVEWSEVVKVVGSNKATMLNTVLG